MPEREFLPRYQRAGDPPEKDRLQYRLWLAAHRYPVHLALLLALLIVCLPVYMLLSSGAQQRATVGQLQIALREADTQRDTLKAALGQVQAQRRTAALESCHKYNHLALALRRENLYLGSIVVNGTKATLSYDAGLLARLGLPPYAARLKLAEAQAKRIVASGPRRSSCQADANRLVHGN